jgi:hypothetical protein
MFCVEATRTVTRTRNTGSLRFRRLLARHVAAAALTLCGLAGSARAGGMPYDLFDRLRKTPLEIGGGRVEVAFATDEGPHFRESVLAWISNAARAVATYYGRLPVEHVRVLVLPNAGSRIGPATTFGYGGAAIKVSVGSETAADAFADDWVMTHEMVHLALPEVGDQHDWLSEGLATYVEPLGRAQAGQIPAERVWADLVWGLPHGLPERGDRGLDHTPTWGRTYWGGALFCLVADLEIRKRTANRKGLQDALRAVVAAGGNVEARWPIERVLETGDRATGVRELRELYARMKATPVAVDLKDLWRKLGVRGEGRRLVLDDSAPLVEIRRAIVRGRSD